MNENVQKTVTQTVQSEKPRHIPVRTAEGSRTSVSFGADVYAGFVQKAGGEAAFRSALNDAAIVASPRPGVSRSVAVRLELEKRLEKPAT